MEYNYTLERDNWKHNVKVLVFLRGGSPLGLGSLYKHITVHSTKSLPEKMLNARVAIAVEKYRTLKDYLFFRRKGTGEKITAFGGYVDEVAKKNHGLKLKNISIDDLLNLDELKTQREIFKKDIQYLEDRKKWSKKVTDLFPGTKFLINMLK